MLIYRVKVEHLAAISDRYKDGFIDELKSNGIIAGDLLEIPSRTYADITARYKLDGSPTVTAQSKNVKPKPESEWPMWAKALRQFAKPEDKGIGDTVARMIGDENSAAFKAWFLATFGKPCGCPGRQQRWNQQFPLEHASS